MTEQTLHSEAVNGKNLNCVGDENKARWIRVSVDMLEHDAFAGEPYSKHAAWLWLIANAAWKPRRFKVANLNGMIELQRGQALAARGYLAHKWMWGEKKVRLFLEFLQSENMIEMVQSKGRFANIVTICNYEKYQTAQENKGQLKDRLGAGSGPVEGQTLTKNTNTTNLDSSSVADTGSVAAREASAPLPISDLKVFYDRLFEAAKPCLDNPVNCQGLINTMIPQMWVDAGCDLERDILPTLAAKAATHKGSPVSSWQYFTKPVTEARLKRLKTANDMAAVTLPASSQQARKSTSSTFFHPPKRSPEQEEREREAWARQMGVIDEHVH